MIDPALLGPGDFVSVRAALVREVGLAEAVVLSRVAFRTTPDYRLAYEHEGEYWWRAPIEIIATETGLTGKQVRRALDTLRADGHVIAEQHQTAGRYDRAFSYRVSYGDTDLPSGANEEVPDGADVLPVKTLKKTPLPPTDASGLSRNRRGYATHENEQNALRALVGLRGKHGLPLTATELLGFCYEVGWGDPWKGYMQIVPVVSQPITDARDPAAVLRHRLDMIEPELPLAEPPACTHLSVEESGYCSFCGEDTREAPSDQ